MTTQPEPQGQQHQLDQEDEQQISQFRLRGGLPKQNVPTSTPKEE